MFSLDIVASKINRTFFVDGQHDNTDVGLAGYFFRRDVGRVWHVAERLEVGMVGANMGFLSPAVIPFGDVKEIGLGQDTRGRTRTWYLKINYVIKTAVNNRLRLFLTRTVPLRI